MERHKEGNRISDGHVKLVGFYIFSVILNKFLYFKFFLLDSYSLKICNWVSLAPKNDYGLASDQKLGMEEAGIGLDMIDAGLAFIN